MLNWYLEADNRIFRPILSNLVVFDSDPQTGDTTITWEKDEISNSIVQYGTVSSGWGGYPHEIIDKKCANVHEVKLSGLLGETGYYFRVGSEDPCGVGPGESIDGVNPSHESYFETP